MKLFKSFHSEAFIEPGLSNFNPTLMRSDLILHTSPRTTHNESQQVKTDLQRLTTSQTRVTMSQKFNFNC